MQDPETKFTGMLQALEVDAIQCARYAYTGLAFRYVGFNDPAILDHLNGHASFWKAVEGALETATLIALGRVYDKRTDVHSADQVLKYAERHAGIFSAERVRARALRRGVSPAAADALVDGLGTVSQDSFFVLRSALTIRTTVYKDRIQTLRHKLYAHTALSPDQRGEFLIFHRDLEQLSVFPWQLWRALHDAFQNGIAPGFRTPTSNIGEVLSERPGRYESKAEHFHAAAATEAFLLWLKAQPLPDEDWSRLIETRSQSAANSAAEASSGSESEDR